jgi:Holliday junction resolvasome RuvABC DNA-binding subunit
MNTLKQRKYKNANSFYNSKICSQALHALGYKDAKFNEAVNGFSLDLYSAEQNVAILTQDSETLCYDRIAPNGFYQLK